MPDHGPRVLNPHKKSGRISRDWNDDCFIDSPQKCLFHKNRWWQYKLKEVKSFPFREVTSVGKFCQAFRVSLLWFVERWNPAHGQKCIFNCQFYIRHHLDPNVLKFLNVILPRKDDWMFNIHCNGQFIINLEWMATWALLATTRAAAQSQTLAANDVTDACIQWLHHSEVEMKRGPVVHLYLCQWWSHEYDVFMHSFHTLLSAGGYTPTTTINSANRKFSVVKCSFIMKVTPLCRVWSLH